MSNEVDAALTSGNRVTALAANVAGVLLDGPQSGTLISCLISNPGAAAVIVGYGNTAAAALANVSALPVAGQSAPQCIVLLAGQSRCFTVAPGQYWSALTAVYLLPGNGI